MMQPPDLNPQLLQGWTPYAIGTLMLVIAYLLGQAMPWVSGKGMTGYIKWQEFRWRRKQEEFKQKMEQQAALLLAAQKKKLIDTLVEGKLTVEGYQALLRMYDAQLLQNDIRLQELEKRDVEKTAQLSDCLQKHAAERAANEGMHKLVSQQAETIEQMCERTSLLEKQYKALENKLKKVSPNDPHPSPPYHITFEDDMEKRDGHD